MCVFDRVVTPRIDIYDRTSNEYLGRAIFPVTPSVESALLGMINSATIPGSIMLQDVTFLPSSSKYVPPGIFLKYPRNGIIRAEFRDANSKLWIPADIYFTFDAQARGNVAGDKYHFDSLEYTNIGIQDTKIRPQGGSPQAGTT
ncbi:hypothetical protein SDC9_72602 [bioreactor metagenome]|uniref:Uncharacterized protein n=1 Tax=bioreactor metagenome TaxID=1076179 RepID=A0A644YDZ1_9ZZZZ